MNENKVSEYFMDHEDDRDLSDLYTLLKHYSMHYLIRNIFKK